MPWSDLRRFFPEPASFTGISGHPRNRPPTERGPIDQQREFLTHGVRHLRPLSRAAVAQQLGVHESTVSRATASKYVMLPNGEVIPYAHFFTPSLSVKDIMKEVIEKEGKPLTDSEIVERLKERGIHIARRTVAKYRMQLAILPSSLR